jgi:hypothetical protein
LTHVASRIISANYGSERIICDEKLSDTHQA